MKRSQAKAWQAALEYKQNEIDELENTIIKQNQENELLWSSNKKLQAENKKLREALEDFILESEHEPSCKYTEAFGFREDCKCMDRRYYNRDECITRAREALKEVGEV
jgi:predicted RNase H-like nuclease (RuvC/YqgF family)